MATGEAIAVAHPPRLDKVCGGARAIHEINDDVIDCPQAAHSRDGQSLQRSGLEPQEEDDKHQSRNAPYLGGSHIPKKAELSMQTGELQALDPAGNSHIEGKVVMLSRLETQQQKSGSR